MRPDGSHTDYNYGDTIGSLYVQVLSDLDATRRTESKQFFDGLGRVTRSATYENFDTTHPWLAVDTTYDALGRKEKVSMPHRAREGKDIFSTDKWTEITSSVSNSQWSAGYIYDAAGNLIKRRDSRDIVTTYGYDALNRSTTVRYADSVLGPDNHTKDIDRHYDGAINGKGRFHYLNWDSSPNGNTRFDSLNAIDEYDVMGRTLTYRQHFYTNGVASAAYTMLRTYDRAGNVLTETYPSGHAVTYNYDGAGRLGDNGVGHEAFKGNLGDGAARIYSSGIIYGVLGGMAQEQFGTTKAIYNKLSYNSRGQLSAIRVSTQPNNENENRGAIINQYSTICPTCTGTDNNGNLKKQEVHVPTVSQEENYAPVSWAQNYEYDGLNRLTSVFEDTGIQASNWKQTFGYDRYGNRTIDQDAAKTYGAGIPKSNFTVDTANNRLGVPAGQSGTMSYDASGNLTTDTYSGAAVLRTYDAENRMTKEVQANNSVAAVYTYDGSGQRVRRKVGGVETWQVYGMGGELLAEYAANGAPTAPQKEYGYRNGQLLVQATGGASGGTAPSFHDNPLKAGETPVCALHITELRDAINQVRISRGMEPAVWLETVASGVGIKAAHIQEMRDRLDQALGGPAVAYEAELTTGKPDPCRTHTGVAKSSDSGAVGHEHTVDGNGSTRHPGDDIGPDGHFRGSQQA